MEVEISNVSKSISMLVSKSIAMLVYRTVYNALN